MVTSGGSSSKPAAATEAVAPEAIIEQLRAVRQQIPEYQQLGFSGERALRRAAHVDAEFAHAAINTVGASGTMQAAVGRTSEDLRREKDEITRWSAVEDELRAMLKGVATANLVRRHRLGLTTLQTYNISRQLVRNPDHAELLPHVDGMKRMKKFARRRGKAPVEPPTVPPTVQPPTVQPPTVQPPTGKPTQQ
jgi:hypothetical protein